METHQGTRHMAEVAVKLIGERKRLSVNDARTIGFPYGKNLIPTSQYIQR